MLGENKKYLKSSVLPNWMFNWRYGRRRRISDALMVATEKFAVDEMMINQCYSAVAQYKRPFYTVHCTSIEELIFAEAVLPVRTEERSFSIWLELTVEGPETMTTREKAEGYVREGIGYEEDGEYSKAEQMYIKAIEIDPSILCENEFPSTLLKPRKGPLEDLIKAVREGRIPK